MNKGSKKFYFFLEMIAKSESTRVSSQKQNYSIECLRKF